MGYQYETLAYVARLSFRDVHGLDARFECYQRIRVLDPDLQYLIHEIWGDGDQLYDYVSPNAAPIHIAEQRGRTRVLSRLSRPFQRGEEIQIHSTRRIHHAFKDDTKFYWEYSPLTPTEHARVAIDFPLARNPSLLSTSRTANTQDAVVERTGTKHVVLRVNLPTLNSVYRVSWSW